MEPTFSEGDRVLVSVWGRLKEDDVVVVHHNDQKHLKRITSIEEDGFHVEGDNKERSTDSRDYGFVEKKDIVGKVIAKY